LVQSAVHSMNITIFVTGRSLVYFGEIYQRKDRCPQTLPGHPDGREACRARSRARRACPRAQRRRRLEQQDQGLRGRRQPQETPLSQSLNPDDWICISIKVKIQLVSGV